METRNKLLSLSLMTTSLLLAACSSSQHENQQDSAPVVETQASAPTYVDSDDKVVADELGGSATPLLARESSKKESDTASHVGLAKMKVGVERELIMQDVAQRRSALAPASVAIMPPSVPDLGNERYQLEPENKVVTTAQQSVSTFSIDVDTAAYANVRRFLNNGQLPPVQAVRIEEMINYFDYDYAQPDSAEQPFQITTEMGPTPWNNTTQLLHVGIKGYQSAQQQAMPKNLVFLLDVSGSMNSPKKLFLVKRAMRLLVDQLTAKDKVAIVVYAGASGVALPATAGDKPQQILAALDSLRAGGSTNGASGINLAYQIAQQNRVNDGINRVILATDGDFNVGVADNASLLKLIKQQKQSGVGLTVLGVGMGNYNDAMLEQISNAGDGNAAYIDSIQEAKKVLVHDLQANLLTIAKDTKIQIEFNPAQVANYRLIGYENRMLQQQDFDNDRVDAGEVGAGHSVTALYEITLKQAGRYGKVKPDVSDGELGFLKIRYKQPDQTQSVMLSHPLLKRELKTELDQTSDNYRFAAAVAAMGQRLRNSSALGDYRYQEIRELARQAKGQDKQGYREEFIDLVELARDLERQSLSSDNPEHCCAR